MADGRLRAIEPQGGARDVTLLKQRLQDEQKVQIRGGNIIHFMHDFDIEFRFPFSISMIQIEKERRIDREPIDKHGYGIIPCRPARA